MQQVMPELLAHRCRQLLERAVSVAEFIKVFEHTMVFAVVNHASLFEVLQEMSFDQGRLFCDSIICGTDVNHSFRPYLACEFHHLIIVLPVCKRGRCRLFSAPSTPTLIPAQSEAYGRGR